MNKSGSYLKLSIEYFLKAIVLIVFIFPFLWMISTSFQTITEILKSPPTLIPSSLQWINYVTAMSAGPYLTYTINSVIITVCVIVLQFFVMIPAAYAFARYRFRGQGFLFGIVLLALMIPSQITFIPIYLMMGDWGLIDTLLPQILPFMANAFGIFMLRQYFMQVNEEIIEAARIDNASEFQIMFRIMTPMSIPALATIALFSFVAHWNDYFWPLVMTNSVGVRTLPLGIKMLQASEGVTQWQVVMAGNVILVLPILIVYFACSKQIVKAFVYGGIK